MPPLRFERAEYGAAPAGPGTCTYCGRSLTDVAFEVLHRPACATCARQVIALAPADSRPAFLKAAAAGTLVALGAGLLLATLVVNLATFGARIWAAYIASLGVGWAIARGMRLASGGVRGRRYQVVAALLTYAAIVVPMQFGLPGTYDIPWWATPFLLLRPIAFLFVGLSTVGIWQLLAAGLGIRVAWAMLRSTPPLVRQIERGA